MERTTIMLPPELRAVAKRLAKARGISLGEFIRKAIERELGKRRDSIFDDISYPRLRGMEGVHLTDDDLYGPVRRPGARKGRTTRVRARR